jgi:hypothetical protein
MRAGEVIASPDGGLQLLPAEQFDGGLLRVARAGLLYPCRQTDDLRAKVFEDRITPRNWRVENGGYEVAVFGGPKARERALRYADREYGEFDKI